MGEAFEQNEHLGARAVEDNLQALQWILGPRQMINYKVYVKYSALESFQSLFPAPT